MLAGLGWSRRPTMLSHLIIALIILPVALLNPAVAAGNDDSTTGGVIIIIFLALFLAAYFLPQLSQPIESIGMLQLSSSSICYLDGR